MTMKKATIDTPEAKQALVNKVRSLASSEGITLKEAVKKSGVDLNQYIYCNNWLNKRNDGPVSKKQKAQMLTVTHSPSGSPLVIAMGQPEDVNKALAHLAQIFGAGQ